MSELNRRNFLQRAMILGAATAVGGVFAACNKDEGGATETAEGAAEGDALDCTDVSGLEEAQVAMRESMAYVEASTTEGSNCENCALFTAGGGCGSCSLLAGPINPAGYCTAWAAAS